MRAAFGVRFQRNLYSNASVCLLPDLQLENAFLVLLNVDVDGEMGVDVSHLVLVALGHADDEVVDESTDGTQRSDILALAVVQLDIDDVLLWV